MQWEADRAQVLSLAAHIQEGAAGHVENDAAQGPDVSFLTEGEVESFRGHPGLLTGVCGQKQYRRPVKSHASQDGGRMELPPPSRPSTVPLLVLP
jgi:hypothetical protein